MGTFRIKTIKNPYPLLIDRILIVFHEDLDYRITFAVLRLK